jgi:Emfourin
LLAPPTKRRLDSGTASAKLDAVKVRFSRTGGVAGVKLETVLDSEEMPASEAVRLLELLKGAEAAARALREALHSADRFFIAGEENALPAIYSISHHGGFPRLVLQVTPRDAVAYSRRSCRDVDPRLLAERWLAVVFLNGAPMAALSAPGGDSLMILRDSLRRSVGTHPQRSESTTKTPP